MKECRVASLLHDHSNKMMKYIFQQLLIPATIIFYIIPDVGISESTFHRIATLQEIFELQQTQVERKLKMLKFFTNWKCCALMCCMWQSFLLAIQDWVNSAVLWQWQKNNSKWWERSYLAVGVRVCGGVLVVFSIPETSNSFQRLSPFHDLDGDDSDENISEISLGRLLQSFIACHHKQCFCEHVKPLKVCIC